MKKLIEYLESNEISYMPCARGVRIADAESLDIKSLIKIADDQNLYFHLREGNMTFKQIL